MKAYFAPSLPLPEEIIYSCIENFDLKGTELGNQDRNKIKCFETEYGITVNVKAFKIPNLVNKVVYRFFRKSKAQRSFEYAQHLQKNGLGTPQPLAYLEAKSLLCFGKSYYVCEHIEADYTYRDFTKDFTIPNYEEILRAFTRFTFKLHENNILFLDHSPGNTLIKLEDGEPNFYLVDLNRMLFKPLSLDERIKNFARLTTHKKMVELMSDEYSKCMQLPFDVVFEKMWAETQDFQAKFKRKKRIKKKIKFWK